MDTTGGHGGCDGLRHAQQPRRPPRAPPASTGTVDRVISSLLHTRWVSCRRPAGGGADVSHHVTTGLCFRKLTWSWFSASADDPPEPCWYCLRTREPGSRPETGQQVFFFCSFDYYDFRDDGFRVFYRQLCCEETEITLNCIVISSKSIRPN